MKDSDSRTTCFFCRIQITSRNPVGNYCIRTYEQVLTSIIMSLADTIRPGMILLSDLKCGVPRRWGGMVFVYVLDPISSPPTHVLLVYK